MFKQKWLIGLVVFDGLVIIALAVYLFLNFSSMNLTKGIILVIIAGIIMLSVIGLMLYIVRKLSPPKTANKNTLPKS